MRNDVDFTVVGGVYKPDRILFALPGRGGTGRGLVDDLYLSRFVTILNRSKLGRIMLVAVDGGESYWHPRQNGENRLGMLLDDVIPWVRETYSGRHAILSTIGWSMGGFGALLAAELRPNLFAATCGVSPAIWINHAQQQSAVPDAFDGAKDFARYDLFLHASALIKTNVRIVCGKNDPFFPFARAFAQRLKRTGVRTTALFGDGCHTVASWQQTVLRDLRFVVT